MTPEEQSRRGGARRAQPTRRSRGPLLLVAVLLVAMLVGAGAAWYVNRDAVDVEEAAPCAGPSITVAATPEIAPVVTEVVGSVGCDQVTIEPVASAAASALVSTGKGVPDVWIPDSSTWVARASTAAPYTPIGLVDSVATSPIVLVTAAAPPATWVEALGTAGFVPGDPLTSTVAAAPLVAAAAEAQQGGIDLAASLVPLAQSQAGKRLEAPDDVARLGAVAADGTRVVAASEQAHLAHAPSVPATVPGSASLMLDYPAVVTADGARRAAIDETLQSLRQVLGSSDLLDALRAAGFRAPTGEPLEGGVGAVQPLRPEAEQVSTVLQSWTRLVMPTRSLAVIDVSGSMDFEAAGGQTRMDVTTAVTSEGLGLFPDAAAIGLWAFSERIAGNSDYRELVPIRPLGGDGAGGGTQRRALLNGLGELASLTGGGTGLYDTTLAAYRKVLSSYDPQAANSVLLFTDGANDDPGSITQAQLLEELRRLADPTRPVRIIAIGITADADAKALRTIARATGGDAYIAEDPADMAVVFQQALGSRT